MTPKRGLLIAAPASGSGKTTVTLGLLRALRDRGAAISGAKSGPDYIDPTFHAAAAGAPAVTLDAWAMDADALRARAAAQPGDRLLIEGAMGALDGAGRAGRGSAADLAATLGAPVALVVDAGGLSQSAALAAAGLRALRPDLTLAGVILNRVASPRHAAMAAAGLAAADIPCFGALPRTPALASPARHLGLTPAGERPDLDAFLAGAAAAAAEHLDIGALSAAFAPLRAAAAPPRRLAPLGQRIAVAQDAAFLFAYPHLLADWRAQGAEIRPFSPLADQPPDPEADALFLPGGYPELHAGALSAAARFRAGAGDAAARGVRIYGECGGYMALGAGLEDAEGRRWPMLGLLPVETSFKARRLTLGYRRLTPRIGAPIEGPVVGHEHHYAQAMREGEAPPLFDAADADGAPLGPIGRRVGAVSGSFAHIIAPL